MFFVRTSFFLCVLLLIGGACTAAEDFQLQDEKDKISYSVGHQIGADFRRQGVALNREAMLRGVLDGMQEGAKPLMTEDEMRVILVSLKKKVDGEAQKKLGEEVAASMAQGKKFLAENAQKEGVVVLDSGLQYVVLQEGQGKSPKEDDTVEANHRTTLLDGTVLGSSGQGQPASFQVALTIPGLKEALLRMQEGAKWRIFVPENLAFGSVPNTPMAGKTVIFEVELLAVKSTHAP